ncbi:hypothetical protein GWK47_032589 [Chionoecetes opilio]|uniref:Uncharacterized protein n=1 Tax=Chionoecetes opilio TaxID=41210 RepID=A0A8J5D0N6_CHIOP|nr:hypothetical protein GWK47_032589 [Chionoecetes opilio]
MPLPELCAFGYILLVSILSTLPLLSDEHSIDGKRPRTLFISLLLTPGAATSPRFPLTRPSHSFAGETVANGDDDAHHSTLSHSSKEGSPTKDTSLTDDSMSKDKKKKKKGLRTPSFLKKKKDKKKEKEAAHH